MSKQPSLDELRAARTARHTGAPRRFLPPRSVGQAPGAMYQDRPMGYAQAPVVPGMPQTPVGGGGPSCRIGGHDKVIEDEVTLAASGTHDFDFDFPGAFCVNRMYVIATADVVFVNAIKVGITDAILSGRVSANIFSPEAECCPDFCLDCVCAPGYPLRIGIESTSSVSEFVSVILFGTFSDACPPSP